MLEGAADCLKVKEQELAQARQVIETNAESARRGELAYRSRAAELTIPKLEALKREKTPPPRIGKGRQDIENFRVYDRSSEYISDVRRVLDSISQEFPVLTLDVDSTLNEAKALSEQRLKKQALRMVGVDEDWASSDHKQRWHEITEWQSSLDHVIDKKIEEYRRYVAMAQ